MKHYLNLCLLCWIFSAGGQQVLAQSSTMFGSYVGTMQHAKTAKDQLVKLDLIFSRGSESQFDLQAILSFYFGDFGSKEYVSYHFDNVTYNLVTGTLVFDQADQDLTLVTTSFGGGRLEAIVRSSVAGDVGNIVLEKDGSASPTRDHIRSVAGKYEGSCNGIATILQLMTYKTTQDTLRLGNPFGSYNITGQVGDRETFSCPNARRKPCTTDLIHSGSYDFYQGELTLFGRRTSYRCEVDGTTLSCGSCTFDKTIGDSDSGSIRRPLHSLSRLGPADPSEDPALTGSASSIGGEYRGYLHHERLDQYQATAINIVTYQEPGNDGSQTLQMSASAKLYFGDFASPETLPYRFHKRGYNVLSPVFVFERMEDDVDAILQVTHLGDGVIRGVWYSILFGRVGTFELTKDTLPTLPGDAKLFEQISGDYESPTFKLRVSTRLDASPVNTENPFFPQTFAGYFWYKSGIAPRIEIVNGSYDFYTGKVAFEVEDEGRIAIGDNESPITTLRLLWPPKVLTTLLPDYELEAFTK